MIGRWHVDQDQGSTDVDWRADGACAVKGLFGDSGFAVDLSKDTCTWTFDPVDDFTFAIAYRDAVNSRDALVRLVFKIISPSHIRNVEKGYDAYRVACPSDELALLRDGLADLEQQAASNPNDVATKLKLASRYDGIAIAEAVEQGLRRRRAIGASCARDPTAHRLRGSDDGKRQAHAEAVARELWAFRTARG